LAHDGCHDAVRPTRVFDALEGGMNFDTLIVCASARGEPLWKHRRVPEILGVLWFKLPEKFRQRWWRETDYGRRPPAAEFAACMPELLAIL
jgi:hypothetical protein